MNNAFSQQATVASVKSTEMMPQPLEVAGNDLARIEFEIEDIISRLAQKRSMNVADYVTASSCSGCHGCKLD